MPATERSAPKALSLDRSGLNLPLEVEQRLRQLGYEICGDDDVDGWYWRHGDFDSRRTTLAEDRIELAILAALDDLVGRHEDLLALDGKAVRNPAGASPGRATR